MQCRLTVEPRVHASESGLPLAWAQDAGQLFLRRCRDEGSEHGARGLCSPLKMVGVENRNHEQGMRKARNAKRWIKWWAR